MIEGLAVPTLIPLGTSSPKAHLAGELMNDEKTGRLIVDGDTEEYAGGTTTVLVAMKEEHQCSDCGDQKVHQQEDGARLKNRVKGRWR
uniref:Uncharacterized protein n=1 Tax=Oryza sativa subsp. japonica TaxID=39947 RepID=Q6F2Y3_ORYSJ|nr:hypothetical protein [Oryza sativa Japonica Group]